MNLFFDTELDLCASMIESLAKELDAVSDQLDVVNSQVESCEAPLEAYADPSGMIRVLVCHVQCLDGCRALEWICI